MHSRALSAAKSTAQRISLFLITIAVMRVCLPLCVDIYCSRSVGGETPELFPLVVVIGNQEKHASILYFRDLEKMKERNPKFEFYRPGAPPNTQEEQQFRMEIEKNVQADGGRSKNGFPSYASFTVLKQSFGSATIKAQCTHDDDWVNSGTYEIARNGDFKPISYMHFRGPGAPIEIVFGCGLFSLAASWLLLKLMSVVLASKSNRPVQ